VQPWKKASNYQFWSCGFPQTAGSTFTNYLYGCLAKIINEKNYAMPERQMI